MLSLRTGLPGHGKTLRTIWEVEQVREKTERIVYQNGIKDLKLPWHELDNPRHWMDVPDGSIVVIDECQRVFPPRAAGSAVPEHVRALETHRHRGIDMYLVTQHPRLLDSHVRSLVEVWEHVKRPFGQSYAKVVKWQECHGDPSRALEDAEQERWKFPLAVFDWYTSATVHTVRPRYPLGKILLALAIFGFLVWVAIRMYPKIYPDSVPVPVQEKPQPPQQLQHGASSARSTAQVSPPSSSAPAPATDAAGSSPVLDAQGWAREWVPVIAAVPASAPAYQRAGSTRPAAFPRVVGCVASASACECFTQQGTTVPMEPAQCVAFIQRPPFDPYRADPVVDQQPAVSGSGARAPETRAAAAAPVAYR